MEGRPFGAMESPLTVDSIDCWTVLRHLSIKADVAPQPAREKVALGFGVPWRSWRLPFVTGPSAI